MLEATFMLVVGPAFYAFIAYCFLRNHKRFAWECACAFLLGGLCLTLLRFRASELTWRSWAVDGALGFVGLNIGMVVGVYFRHLSLLRSERC